MSKMDGLRAMREAKYAAAVKRAGQGAAAPARPKAAAAGPKSAETSEAPGPAASPEPPAPTEQLCGHRNMGGRSCTREHGHAAKSHRYS